MAKTRYYLHLNGYHYANGQAVYYLRRIYRDLGGNWQNVQGKTTADKMVAVFKSATALRNFPGAELIVVREPKHVQPSKSHVLTRMRAQGFTRPYNRLRAYVPRAARVNGPMPAPPRRRTGRPAQIAPDPPLAQAVPAATWTVAPTFLTADTFTANTQLTLDELFAARERLVQARRRG